jgi:hypothetical protein
MAKCMCNPGAVSVAEYMHPRSSQLRRIKRAECGTIMDPMKSTCRLIPSLAWVRTSMRESITCFRERPTRHSVVHQTLYFSGVICILQTALGCAGETQERPRAASHATRSDPAKNEKDLKSSDAPFPDTAFRDDPSASSESSAPPSPSTRSPQTDHQSRFATRTIGETSGRDGERRFHGAPVDLDLKSADVQDVFRLLSDVGKVNIVVDGAVSGTVTMRLRHVPWDQALDVIAQARGLAYSREGNVILVRPLGATTPPAAKAAPAK